MPTQMTETGPSTRVEQHVHTWIEGPNGHSICEVCGRAYSPVHDYVRAAQEVADLQGRIDRTLGYLGEISDLTDASLQSADTTRTIINAVVQSLTTPCGKEANERG